MANRLITITEAAEDLRQVILSAAAEAEREGVAPEVFCKALNTYFAALGGFPITEQDEARS